MNKPALRCFYEKEVVSRLRECFKYENVHLVPKLEKIVINSGISADADKTWVDEVIKDIALISGQRPSIRLSTCSISNFKLREGVPNGVRVTLRGNQMYNFAYKLIAVALPLIRDFRGLGTSFDGRGNYTLGIKDHSIFPEVNVDRDRKNMGMDITFVTSAIDDNEGRELLKLLGFPFVGSRVRN